MTLDFEVRDSDSPYVETITCGRTLSDGSSIRPAELSWHMVFAKWKGGAHALAVGALPSAGVASWKEGAEILWIKFRPGTFLSCLPARTLLDKETKLPEAARTSFWLKGHAWQFPDYENADTFVARLVRAGVLDQDPVVSAVLKGQPQAVSSRTVRHRFLHATGLTHTHIRQVERARRAAALLSQGSSILDAVHEAGYFDQPHLTRSLKQWIGHTPAQIIRMRRPDCHPVQDSDPDPGYPVEVFTRSR
jgi:hypothetical protein